MSAPKNKGELDITVCCSRCGKDQEPFRVHLQELQRWVRGELIQNAFNLNASQRELLMTGICDPCYKTLFPPEEE